ncbi:glutathione S-transferase theta-1-like [Saccostrea echinata]|uniref:glutathione S-transferase theta-1-like n=1 Tax=Saccostrea echinata TaxID=191078 RepID=UPI002A81B73B|nr:glutathione S-transferase theta-1-like [Saccostrea echinata]
MPNLKLFYDLMSQPSRAVYIFLKANNIPFEAIQIAIRNGDHHKEEYTRITQFQQVPVIDDNGFVLTESVAILQYLCMKYKLADHWYPLKNPETHARVQEYLNWQHANTRFHGTMLFRILLRLPQETKQPVNQQEAGEYRKGNMTVVRHLDKYFLKDKKFLCGEDISIADILAVCELMQLHVIDEDYIIYQNDKVKAWLTRVKNRLGPAFDEGHKIVYKVHDLYKSTWKSELAKL